MKAGPPAPVPRTALTIEEAAASLGVSLSHFRRHVLPHLRVIRSGSCRLVPVAELGRWASENATLAGGE
jgi:excisionase family DNA binding protein